MFGDQQALLDAPIGTPPDFARQSPLSPLGRGAGGEGAIAGVRIRLWKRFLTPFSFSMLACGALLIALAGPALIGRVYTADDLGAFHLPMRAFYSDCLARGEAFDWSPQLYCGFYLTGEGQVGAYHPLHLASISPAAARHCLQSGMPAQLSIVAGRHKLVSAALADAPRRGPIRSDGIHILRLLLVALRPRQRHRSSGSYPVAAGGDRHSDS